MSTLLSALLCVAITLTVHQLTEPSMRDTVFIGGMCFFAGWTVGLWRMQRFYERQRADGPVYVKDEYSQ